MILSHKFIGSASVCPVLWRLLFSIAPNIIFKNIIIRCKIFCREKGHSFLYPKSGYTLVLSIKTQFTICKQIYSDSSLSISSTVGRLLLNSSRSTFVNSYSAIPIGCEMSSSAYSATTSSLSLQIRIPIVG